MNSPPPYRYKAHKIRVWDQIIRSTQKEMLIRWTMLAISNRKQSSFSAWLFLFSSTVWTDTRAREIIYRELLLLPSYSTYKHVRLPFESKQKPPHGVSVLLTYDWIKPQFTLTPTCQPSHSRSARRIKIFMQHVHSKTNTAMDSLSPVFT